MIRWRARSSAPLLTRPARGTTWALATVLCFGFAGAARATPTTTTSADDSEHAAKIRYEQAVAAFEAGRYQEAAAGFLAADELAPRPALSFDAGRAYDQLGDSASALKCYRDYLRREAAPANADAVHARIAAIEAALAARGVQELSVESRPTAAFISIDGQPRGVTPWMGELTPGRHRVVLTRESYAPATRDVDVDAVRTTELSVELQAARVEPTQSVPARASPLPSAATLPPARRFGPWPWIAVGTGGAALLASGALELARRSAEHDAHTAPTQIAYADAFHAEQSRQTAARVLLGIGGAFVVTGGILLVLESSSKERPTVAATLACNPDRCSGSLQGSF